MSATTIEQAVRMSDMTAEVVVVAALEADVREGYPDVVMRHAERVAQAAYVEVVSAGRPVGAADRPYSASKESLNRAWEVARERAQAVLFLHRAATAEPSEPELVITRDPDELAVLREALSGHPDLETLAHAGMPEVSLLAVSALRSQLDDVEGSLVVRARGDGASWRRIGQLLGRPPQSVWEQHASSDEAPPDLGEDDLEAQAWEVRAGACHDLTEGSAGDF